MPKDPAPLKVKEVWVKERRYIVCLNEEARRKDAHDREAIVAHLKEQLRSSGDKSLVGNKGYRRYLKVEGSGRFVIDEKQVEQRYDGVDIRGHDVLVVAFRKSRIACLSKFEQLEAPIPNLPALTFR